MNVLILTPELYPYVGGGVGIHAYYVSKLLASKPRHKVVALSACPRGMKNICKSSDAELFHVIYLLPFPFKSISYMIKSLMIFLLVRRKVKVNIIHVHTAGLQTMLLAYLVGMINNIQFIVTCHGSDIRIFKKVRIARFLQSFLLKRASYVTCVSKEIAQILTDEYGLEDDRISIVPNGFDDDLVSKRKASLFRGKEKRIVFVGGLRAAKDPITLIRAFERISIRHVDILITVDMKVKHR